MELKVLLMSMFRSMLSKKRNPFNGIESYTTEKGGLVEMEVNPFNGIERK